MNNENLAYVFQNRPGLNSKYLIVMAKFHCYGQISLLRPIVQYFSGRQNASMLQKELSILH